jgi:hypothetical protein
MSDPIPTHPIVLPEDLPEPVPPPAQQVLVEIATDKVLATGWFPSGTDDPTTKIVDLDEAAWAEFQAAPPGQKYLAEDGTLTVVPPPPPPIEYDRSITVKAQMVTTDDQPLVVFTFPCDLKSRYRANMSISGIDRANFVSREMEGRFVWKRTTGNAVMVGITIVSNLGEAASSSWAPNAVPSGTDVVFTVKGASGRTVDWLLTGTVEVFAPEGLEA